MTTSEIIKEIEKILNGDGANPTILEVGEFNKFVFVCEWLNFVRITRLVEFVETIGCIFYIESIEDKVKVIVHK